MKLEQLYRGMYDLLGSIPGLGDDSGFCVNLPLYDWEDVMVDNPQGASATPKLAKQPSVSKSVTRYCLVTTTGYGSLNESVDQLLEQGWQCQGGVAVVHQGGNYPRTSYYQAMIKVIDLATMSEEPV